MGPAPVTWIPGSGWPRGFLALTLGMGAIIAVGSVLLVGARSVSVLGLEALLELVGWAELFWFAFMVGLVWGSTPRVVGISSDGVTFRAFWYQRFCPWSALGAPDGVSAGRVWFPFQGASSVGATASTEQAKAILVNTFCPRWPVSPILLQHLGFQPYRGPNGELVPLSK